MLGSCKESPVGVGIELVSSVSGNGRRQPRRLSEYERENKLDRVPKNPIIGGTSWYDRNTEREWGDRDMERRSQREDVGFS